LAIESPFLANSIAFSFFTPLKSGFFLISDSVLPVTSGSVPLYAPASATYGSSSFIGDISRTSLPISTASSWSLIDFTIDDTPSFCST